MPLRLVTPVADPIRVAIVNDYEIVVAGVATMLADHDEVEVVALDRAALRTASVDVVLYDTFGQRWHDGDHLEDLVDESGARVVVFTWTFDAATVSLALDAGAAGYLSKGISREDLVAALRAVHAGERVTGDELPHTDAGLVGGAWPGQERGLSARESEILTFSMVYELFDDHVTDIVDQALAHAEHLRLDR